MNTSVDEISSESGSDYVSDAESPTDVIRFASVNETQPNCLRLSNSNNTISSSDDASTYNSATNSMRTTLVRNNEGTSNGAKVSNRERHATTQCVQNVWIQNNVSYITISRDIQLDCSPVQARGVENAQSVSSHHSPDAESTSTLNNDSIVVISDDSEDESRPTVSTKEKSSSHIEHQQFISVPNQLFSKPFPTERNLFKSGQKLECIDPRNQSKFCVATVAETLGYRIKLHFDGYDEMFDFWVNADCPYLFHAKWCEKNLRKLTPPKSYKSDKEFSWDNYLKSCRAEPAPISNFASSHESTKATHEFYIGTKFEAVDILSPSSDQKRNMCVASVFDVLGDRILVHFDGWSEIYDYWTDIKSTNYLYPVGWCKMNNKPLIVPVNYRRRKYFTWPSYLAETESIAVPQTSFCPKPLREFSIDMTIEIVDLVIPSIIRIAKIIDVKSGEIKVLYDGFDIIYAYWVDNNSPDIHPVGWCFATNHPIEEPPVNLTLRKCNYHDCNGNYTTNDSQHKHIEKCPYELVAWTERLNNYKMLPYRMDYNPDAQKSNRGRKVNTGEKTNKRKRKKRY